ncbi:MAG: hypothetical protein ACYC5F_05275 [Thermoleophilia bacterium]
MPRYGESFVRQNFVMPSVNGLNWLQKADKAQEAFNIANAVQAGVVENAPHWAGVGSEALGPGGAAFLKASKGAGFAGAAVGIGVAGIEFGADRSYKNGARLAVQGAAGACMFIPGWGWVAAGGIELMDLTVGDTVYGWADSAGNAWESNFREAWGGLW